MAKTLSVTSGPSCSNLVTGQKRLVYKKINYSHSHQQFDEGARFPRQS